MAEWVDGEYVIETVLYGGSSCYEWAEAQVGRKDGKLFIREGSGCSCHDISECDWGPITSWEEVVATADFVRETDPTEKTEFLAEVAALMKKYKSEDICRT